MDFFTSESVNKKKIETKNKSISGWIRTSDCEITMVTIILLKPLEVSNDLESEEGERVSGKAKRVVSLICNEMIGKR